MSSSSSDYELPSVGDVVRFLLKMLLVMLAVWLASAGVWSIIAWSGTWNKTDHYRLSEFFATEGFDPTRDYDAVLGNTVDGSYGNIEGSISLFFGTGSGSIDGSISPSSAVKMQIPLDDGTTTIVMVPIDRINYHIITEGQPYVDFEFNDSWFGWVERNYSYDNGWTDFLWYKVPHYDAEATGGIERTGTNRYGGGEWALYKFRTESIGYWLLESVGKVNLYITQDQLNDILYGT